MWLTQHCNIDVGATGPNVGVQRLGNPASVNPMPGGLMSSRDDKFIGVVSNDICKMGNLHAYRLKETAPA